MTKRIYAIPETDNIHDISNDDFIYQAEELGYVWSLGGFQNELNCEGKPTIKITSPYKKCSGKITKLHFRFIDVKNEDDYIAAEQEKTIKWLQDFANYVSNNANDVYNDAQEFANNKIKKG